jgi:DNA-binding CsgD family transcriptional regulator
VNSTLIAPAPAEDIELARLIAAGLTSERIAQRLRLSPGVVRYRLRRALERAGADTSAEFAAMVLGRPVAGA